MTMQPKLILDARADLGEGPAWEAKSGKLYWVDIHAGYLHIYNPQDGTDRGINVGEFIGCAVPCKSGRVALGLKNGFATLDLSTEKLTRLANPEADKPNSRFNDGKCDPAGRFLAGTLNDVELDSSGSLYSLSPGGALKTLITGVSTSNGLAWSPDYRTFYFIDTPTHLVMAYDYDLASGGIANPRPVITAPEEFGFPDGMTSDSEGMLWVAMWGGAQLTRWNPHTGQLLNAVPFQALNISSCCFGGPDLTRLYITSARTGMSEDELARYPLSGGLFCLETNVRGLPTFEFGI